MINVLKSQIIFQNQRNSQVIDIASASQPTKQNVLEVVGADSFETESASASYKRGRPPKSSAQQPANRRIFSTIEFKSKI